MNADNITEAEQNQINELVSYYEKNIPTFKLFIEHLQSIFQTPPLKDLYHSMRWRVKDPAHLRDKLERKIRKTKAAGESFDIDTSNLFERLNDPAGLRLLHLPTTDFP